uniref:DUF4456 domain-containing protein n=1 Tax=Macrostomum lignano TaxID=282301 RepID=A0A1I8FKF3_9PLAT
MALKEPREQLEARAAAASTASVGRSLHSLESRLSEAAATAAAAVADDEDDPSPTLTLEPSTSISASTAASELRQLRDRLAECQEACDALPPGGRHAAAVADQLSNERRRCDVVAALVDAAAKRHAAGDRLAAYLQHCDNFRLRLEARLLRLDKPKTRATTTPAGGERERLETLLAEVRGYSRQLDSLAEEGDQLTEALDSAMARRAVSDRMEQLRKLHGRGCGARLSRARRAYSIRQLLQRCRDLDRFCRTVNEAVELSVAAVAKGGKGGGGLGRAKQAQKELAGLLADLEARGDALKEAEAALAELLDRGGDGDEKKSTKASPPAGWWLSGCVASSFDALRRLLRAHGRGWGGRCGCCTTWWSLRMRPPGWRPATSPIPGGGRQPPAAGRAALLDAGKALLAQTEESFDSAGEKAATAATGDLDDDEEGEADDDSACLARAKTTEALLADAETAAERVKELRPTAKLLDHDMVDERQAEAKRLSDSLISQTEAAQATRQEAALRSIEPGTDEESRERLGALSGPRQPQLDQLDARLQSLQAEKNCRLESARTMRDRLQTQLAGCTWPPRTSPRRLHDSRRIHRLLYEAASLHEALQEKLREVESLASYGAGPDALAMLTDSEFKPLAARRDDLGKARAACSPSEFKGTDAEQVIRDDVKRCGAAAGRTCRQAAEAKRRDLSNKRRRRTPVWRSSPDLRRLCPSAPAAEAPTFWPRETGQRFQNLLWSRAAPTYRLKILPAASPAGRARASCPASLAEHLAREGSSGCQPPQLRAVQSTHRRRATRSTCENRNADIRKAAGTMRRARPLAGRIRRAEFAACCASPAFDGPAAAQASLRLRGRTQ